MKASSGHRMGGLEFLNAEFIFAEPSNISKQGSKLESSVAGLFV